MRAQLVLVALVLTISSARSQERNVALIGSGHLSCGAWTSRQNDRVTRGEQEEWLWGFVSAYNWFVAGDGNVANGADGYGMAAWMNTYCQAHPMKFVVDGADALIAELKATRRR